MKCDGWLKDPHKTDKFIKLTYVRGTGFRDLCVDCNAKYYADLPIIEGMWLQKKAEIEQARNGTTVCDGGWGTRSHVTQQETQIVWVLDEPRSLCPSCVKLFLECTKAQRGVTLSFPNAIWVYTGGVDYIHGSEKASAAAKRLLALDSDQRVSYWIIKEKS